MRFPSGDVGDIAKNEEITEHPSSVNILNAVKVSGRTKNGLGIGFLNSITEKTYTKVNNVDTDQARKVLIEPLTNYNVFVLDQEFNGNSSVSLINTNVIREGSQFRDANVTEGFLIFQIKKIHIEHQVVLYLVM